MLYLVSGCGISAIATKKWVTFWIERIIFKGGVPTITVLSRGNHD